MTPAELRAARISCGLSLADFAAALGYRSTDKKNLRQQICDMEGGRKPITPQVARLAEMFRRHGVPKEWLTQ
jgi:transcriptional regulator with XRE-family HTH domain